MPDNKLTDNEIVKALECCISNKTCEEAKCPLYENGCEIDIQIPHRLALDLINRLQDKNKAYKYYYNECLKDLKKANKENEELLGNIDRLKEENEHYSHNVKEMTDSIRNYQKALEQAKSENERLKNAYKQVAWERDIFAENMEEEIKKDCSYLMLDIKTIKVEAYKEFAEELLETKFKHGNDYIIYAENIYTILKEKVGDNNES